MRKFCLTIFIFLSLFFVLFTKSLVAAPIEDYAICTFSDTQHGFCSRVAGWYCTNDPWNDRVVDSINTECTWNNRCCAPANGTTWRKENSCLGHLGCINPASCQVPYEGYHGVLNICPAGFVCCDEKYTQTKYYGEECNYYDVSQLRELSGWCINDPSACSVGTAGSGNCRNNLICCPSMNTSCVSDLGGECISTLQDCTDGTRVTNTDCVTNGTKPTCCVKGDIPCESSGYECMKSLDCTNKVDGLNCSDPGFVCCADDHDCSTSGGACVRAFCDSNNLLFPIRNFDPCYIRDNASRCCYGTFETCASQNGVDDPICIDGIYVNSIDVTHCCVKPMSFELTKPKDLVYRGPVIEKLEDLLGPVTKMLYYGGLGIGVFYIILAGYKLMASEGDPQRTKAAQEQLTSAVIGIIFILLSVTIIRVIIDEIIKM